MDKSVLDIAIVGGGINGAGIAADAAGRGLAVGLYEAADFASATSSASSKLIHGGLRYLEHFEFCLVRQSLAEREILLKKAPFLIKPMRFCLPHQSHLRPAWQIRIGLLLYDNLARRIRLPASKCIYFGANSVLKREITLGFEYSDCWVDDARLVILNIIQASLNNAEVRNRCRVEKVERHEGLWKLDILDLFTHKKFTRFSRVLINSTGPWAEQFLKIGASIISPQSMRLVKGSHLIVPKVYEEDRAYILQNKDNRIVFIIPYLDKFSIIGTTDIEYNGDPRQVEIDENETDYLLDIYNQYFKYQLDKNDVISSFSGVRPLYGDTSDIAQQVTREHRLELDMNEGNAPLLSVFGGKLTTYRTLAQSAVDKLAPFFPKMKTAWTEKSLLPGAENIRSHKEIEQVLFDKYSWIDSFTAHRIATAYGNRVWLWLENVYSQADLGLVFGCGLTQKEIDYLIDFEFVQCADDLLWRRTKLALYLDFEQQKKVDEYIKSKKSNRSDSL